MDVAVESSIVQHIPEQIAIAGAGVAGAWLYRALDDLGRSADLYDVRDRPAACGIHPCAWGVSAAFLHKLREKAINPEAYVTNRVNRVEMEGRVLEAEVYLIDKPRLIGDLLGGTEVIRGPIPSGRYDRVLDCTGAARAYLPSPAKGDLLCPTRQARMHLPDIADDTIVIRFAGAGYCWAFPLGDRRFHVGCGAFLDPCDDLDRMLHYSGFADGILTAESRRLCACRSTIRMTGPQDAVPHVAAASPAGCPVWGVGESIGTVSPLTGEGILHAIRCAELYLEHEADPHAYSGAVLGEFSWMTGERRRIDRLRVRRWPSLADWRILRRNALTMGIRVGVPDVLAMVGNLRRRRRLGDAARARNG